MNSPVFSAMGRNMGNMVSGNNPFRMVQEFINFANGFKGDPKAEVQNLLNSGRMSQDQYNQLQGMAGQFQSLLSKFPQPK